jgi:hypothetical protein
MSAKLALGFHERKKIQVESQSVGFQLVPNGFRVGIRQLDPSLLEVDWNVVF